MDRKDLTFNWMIEQIYGAKDNISGVIQRLNTSVFKELICYLF